MDQQRTHDDDLCHAHNLVAPLDRPGPYGIRVRLRPGDPFIRLLGADWERYHWYATPAARDRALADMSSEHLYSRRGDRPTLIFEPVDKPANGAPDRR
ncbi:MAG TPA: hypothetical protein VF322_16580 [Gammaproteobacteria bacterium]